MRTLYGELRRRFEDLGVSTSLHLNARDQALRALETPSRNGDHSDAPTSLPLPYDRSDSKCGSNCIFQCVPLGPIPCYIETFLPINPKP